MSDWWNEAMPEPVRHAAESIGLRVDELAVHMAGDLDESGNFAERWLLMDREHIAVLTSAGEVRHRLPVEAVDAVEAVSQVGGGLLRAKTDGDYVPLVRYSAAKGRGFGVISRAFDTFKKEGRIQAHDRDAPAVCEGCGCPIQPHETVCPRCVNKGRVLKRLWSYARQFRWRLVMICFITALGAAMSVVPFGMIKVLLDDVLSNDAYTSPFVRGVASLLNDNRVMVLPVIVIIYAFVTLVEAGMRTLLQYHSVYIGMNLVYQLRGDLFRHVIDMGLPFFDRYKAGELMSRIDHDSRHLEHLFIEAAQFIFRNCILVVWVLALMVWINPTLAIVALLPIPLVVYVFRRLLRFVRPAFHRMRQRHARMSAVLNTAVSGVRLVKAFGQEDYENERFDERSGQLRDTGLELGRTFALVFPAMGITMQIGGWLIWYFGGREVLAGTMTKGELMAYIGLLGLLYGPFTMMLRISRWATESLTSAQRMFDIMDTEASHLSPEQPVPLPTIQGRVTFDNVTFGYEPLKPVLKGIELDIQPGEMIGLVGHSGVGKTTTTNLVLRFYPPDDGEIRIDGVNLLTIAEKDLRSQLASVPQEPYLFAGSVADNIAYGDDDATPEQVLRATMASNAHDFIMKMPDAYDSALGEGGARVSVGEKQRLTIARAIIRDPRILILDEATSSVDTDTEQQIQQALDRLVKGRTTIAIAHRLSTLKNADRLVVLKDGKVAEMGTHAELIEKDGEYKRLVGLQSKMSSITGVGG